MPAQSLDRSQQATRRPLIVGEVLFDVYPDGSMVLGGAPFNVAWHLQALGLQPLLITRIGTGRRGQEILGKMHKWGMDISGVQLDPQRPTGKVAVSFTDHGPAFDIAADQAYDHLDARVDVKDLVGGDPSLIYHGSLITRSTTAAESLHALRARTRAPVFLDVNLRSPWWTKASIARSLLGARWVKLNAEELCVLTDQQSRSSGSELRELARAYRSDHALDAVVLTMGEAGAAVVLEDTIIDARPSVIVKNGDTVGAGDAFSAVFIAGLILNWPIQATLQRASDLAAIICSIKGAISTKLSLYQRLQDEWRRSA